MPVPVDAHDFTQHAHVLAPGKSACYIVTVAPNQRFSAGLTDVEGMRLSIEGRPSAAGSFVPLAEKTVSFQTDPARNRILQQLGAGARSWEFRVHAVQSNTGTDSTGNYTRALTPNTGYFFTVWISVW